MQNRTANYTALPVPDIRIMYIMSNALILLIIALVSLNPRHFLRFLSIK
jgi:hypothetical protein